MIQMMMTMMKMTVPAHEEEDECDDTEDDDDDSKAGEDRGSSGEKVIKNQLCPNFHHDRINKQYVFLILFHL